MPTVTFCEKSWLVLIYLFQWHNHKSFYLLISIFLPTFQILIWKSIGTVSWRMLYQRISLSSCPCPYSALWCHLSLVPITPNKIQFSEVHHFLQGASTCSCPFCLSQCAVRAATEGRILVLEGLEKAERNVLPVLNNLLENREMQLEDGRFLMSAQRYDKLLEVRTTIL